MRDNTKKRGTYRSDLLYFAFLYTPRHGYAVMQFIEDKTKGQLLLGAGTLYGALTSLEKRLDHALWRSGKKKKEYCITPQGKEIAEKELARLHELVNIADTIIGGAYE